MKNLCQKDSETVIETITNVYNKMFFFEDKSESRYEVRLINPDDCFLRSSLVPFAGVEQTAGCLWSFKENLRQLGKRFLDSDRDQTRYSSRNQCRDGSTDRDQYGRTPNSQRPEVMNLDHLNTSFQLVIFENEKASISIEKG